MAEQSTKSIRANTNNPVGYEHSFATIKAAAAASVPAQPAEVHHPHSSDGESKTPAALASADRDANSRHPTADQRDRLYTHLGACMRDAALGKSKEERMMEASKLMLRFLSATLKPDCSCTYKAPVNLGEQILRKRELLANGDVACAPAAIRRGSSGFAASVDAPVVPANDQLDRHMYVQEQCTYEGLLTADQYMSYEQSPHATLKLDLAPHVQMIGRSALLVKLSEIEPTFERQALLSVPSACFLELGGLSGIPGECGAPAPEHRREVYMMVLPDLYISNFFNPERQLQMHWSGSAVIYCRQTKLSSSIAFPRDPCASASPPSSEEAKQPLHALSGCMYSSKGEVVARLQGELDGMVDLFWCDSTKQETSRYRNLHNDMAFMSTRPCVTSAAEVTYSHALKQPNSMLLRCLWNCIADAVHCCTNRMQPLELMLNNVVAKQTAEVQRKKEQCSETRQDDLRVDLRWHSHEFDAVSAKASKGREPDSDVHEIRMEYELALCVVDHQPADAAPRVPPLGPERRPPLEEQPSV